MAHHHGAQPVPESRRMQRLALMVIIPLALLTLVGLGFLWPFGGIPDTGYAPAEQHKARVISVDTKPCPAGEEQEPNGCGTATIELEKDAASGRSTEVDVPTGPGEPVIEAGDNVLVISGDGLEGEELHTIVDHQRSNQLWILLLIFVLVLLVFGRLRGISALVGLSATFLMLLFFVVPAILAGSSPILVAVVGTAAIALSVLYLTHGFSLTTTVAVLGTLAALVLTGFLAWISVVAMQLSGITDDVEQSLQVTHGVDMQGLLIAAIMIGSLGVLDDVTVTQSTTVAELAHANPNSSFAELYGAASRVGRAHIGSVVNTIILAYAGSSLPLLILIMVDNTSFGGVLTTQVIAQEIVRSAVATIGLIAAVPMTTALAAFAARSSR